MELKTIELEGEGFKPSVRLVSLASQNNDTALKVGANGLAEVWLGCRIWLVEAHDDHKPGDSLDPYEPYAAEVGGGPVVNVMTPAEARFIHAYVQHLAA